MKTGAAPAGSRSRCRGRPGLAYRLELRADRGERAVVERVAAVVDQPRAVRVGQACGRRAPSPRSCGPKSGVTATSSTRVTPSSRRHHWNGCSPSRRLDAAARRRAAPPGCRCRRRPGRARARASSAARISGARTVAPGLGAPRSRPRSGTRSARLRSPRRRGHQLQRRRARCVVLARHEHARAARNDARSRSSLRRLPGARQRTSMT